MNEMQMINEPVEVAMGGKVLRVRRLSTAKRRAIVQSVITSQMVDQIKQRAAAAFEGDPERQAGFIEKAILAMPTGKAMADLVSDHVPVDAMVRMVAESSGEKQEVIAELFEDADAADIKAVFQMVVGKKK